MKRRTSLCNRYRKLISMILMISISMSLLTACAANGMEQNGDQQSTTVQNNSDSSYSNNSDIVQNETAQSENIQNSAAEGATDQNQSDQSQTFAQTQEESVVDTLNFPVTLIDQAGRVVTFRHPVERIVSCYDVVTASLLALGLTDKIIGIESNADTKILYQLTAPELTALPAIADSGTIQVEAIVQLSPDIVILPYQLKQSAAEFEVLGISVLIVNTQSQTGFNKCMDLLGKVTGKSERAQELIDYDNSILSQVKNLTQNTKNRPSVYLCGSTSFLSTCTNQMLQHEMIELSGGRSVSSELTDSDWSLITTDQLKNWNPDYMIAVPSRAYDLDTEINNSTLASLSAIKNKNVYTIPALIEPWNTPSPSPVPAILWLTQLLHPDLLTKQQYQKEVQNFYQKYYNIQVPAEELDTP